MTSLPSDSEVSRQLDGILLPLSKPPLYPLPVPAQIRLSDQGGSLSSAIQSARRPNEEDVAAQQAQEQLEAMTRALCDEAHHNCESKVDGLEQWQNRVDEGLVRGQDSQTLLRHVLKGITAMRAVTQSVQDQSNHLSRNASVLMVRKARLLRVQEELQTAIRHFTRMEDLCREAEGPMLSAESTRFPVLFEELEGEMQFLSRNAQFKSAKAYATKLAVAQEATTEKLKTAIKRSFADALRETVDATRTITSPGSASTFTPATSTPTVPPSAFTVSLPNAVDDDASLPGARFAAALTQVNSVFLEKVNAKASLRRMAELRSSFSYSGAEAFGEEPLSTVEDDHVLQDVLKCYCEVRVGLVGPLLKRWLTLWCQTDTASSVAGTPLALSARSLELSIKQTPASPEAVSPLGAVTSPTDASRSVNGDGESRSARDTAATERKETQDGADGPYTPARPTASDAAASASKTGSPVVDGKKPPAVDVSISASTQLPQLAEHISSLLEICLTEEKKVLDEVWLRAEFANYIFPKLVSDVVEELYQAFRSRLVRVDDLASLAHAVEHIQVVNLRQANDAGVTQELPRLWMRMIQDVQERIIFRTSVYLRQEISRGRPTKALVAEYTNIIAAGAPATQLPLIAGVRHTVRLLALLYPTLEFSVFSVFAEEAVETSVQLIRELGKMVLSQASAIKPWGEVMSYCAQLAHLLYVRQELTRIDANITVVEKSLDLSKLARQRKLEIVQSSRDSKKIVESEVQTCSTRLSQTLCQLVVQPLTGAARMTAEQVEKGMTEVEDTAAKGKYLVSLLIAPQHPPTQIALQNTVDARVTELMREVAELHLRSREVSLSPTTQAAAASGQSPSEGPAPSSPAAPS